jgi:hypothetical protein
VTTLVILTSKIQRNRTNVRRTTTHHPNTRNKYPIYSSNDGGGGGINVQIVLGNGNLGLTTPTKARGERRGGAARRLRRRNEAGERGATV